MKEIWSIARPAILRHGRAVGLAAILLAPRLVWGAQITAPSKPLPASVQELHNLTNTEASRQIPASFDATVVYSRGYQRLLFVEDSHFAIFVLPADTTSYSPGDRIHIVGRTAASFRPIVVAGSITLIRHGETPIPTPARFEQLIRAELDSQLVSVRASVRAADVVTSQAAPNIRSARLQLTTEGGHLEAYVDTQDAEVIQGLLDADVEITGAAAGKFDDKMEQTGVVIYVSKLSDIRILKSAHIDPWSLRPVPMDQILSASKVNDLSERIRVIGTITYTQPGSAAVLQSGSKSLWISTQTREPLHVGDIATATGFPSAHDRVLSLVDAEIRDTGIEAPIPPHPATPEQLALWDSSKPIGHQFDLVSTEGQVIAEVRGALEDEYVLSADGHLFSAIYRHPRGTGSLAPMRVIPLKSRIRVTGICLVSDTNLINPGEDAPFDILLRSVDDIEVIAGPSILNVRNLLILVGSLLLLLFGMGVRAWAIERRTRHQTANSAYMERKRAQILADINGARPLPAILEEITYMASFKLRGIPCWCEIIGGPQIGNRPTDPTPYRVAEQKIHGRSGSELGTIFVAPSRGSVPSREEAVALSAAATVAGLAIETRRLYADLVHRSDFDQLTEIHNRFSFERYLEEQILKEEHRAGQFAIIYIDLNDFKMVNDTYGHLVGDLYLCQAASRMKHQLRGCDMLGRLGGDEFAVLLPQIHHRSEIEEVVHRLDRTFEEPFDADGSVVHGSASFGFALYPADGRSKDELLNTADAAMYVAKQIRKEARKQPPVEADFDVQDR